MSNITKITLTDGDVKCEMRFLNLEYLDEYYKGIDMTKVKIHDILGKKLFFKYDGVYYVCPLYQYNDLIVAIATCNLFLSNMIYEVNTTSK